ncbi:MAG: hypothetical protein AB7O68_14790 [Pirellulales bacterium]
MTIYPVLVEPLRMYGGDDPAGQRKFEKDLRTAESISRFINQRMESDHKGRASAIFSFGMIASRLGVTEATVQRYLHNFSGSSDNAIEVHNPISNSVAVKK